MSKNPTTSPDQGGKNWFLKHKFVTGILVIICIGVIASAMRGGGDSAVSTTDSAPSKDKKEVTIVSTSFDDFSILCDTNATNLKKGDVFNTKFKDKYVQWSGVISSIDGVPGSYTVQVKHCPNTPASDIVVTMKDDQKEKLLSVKEGDEIFYRAKLTKFDGLLGLSADDGDLLQ